MAPEEVSEVIFGHVLTAGNSSVALAEVRLIRRSPLARPSPRAPDTHTHTHTHAQDLVSMRLLAEFPVEFFLSPPAQPFRLLLSAEHAASLMGIYRVDLDLRPPPFLIP